MIWTILWLLFLLAVFIWATTKQLNLNRLRMAQKDQYKKSFWEEDYFSSRWDTAESAVSFLIVIIFIDIYNRIPRYEFYQLVFLLVALKLINYFSLVHKTKQGK